MDVIAEALIFIITEITNVDGISHEYTEAQELISKLRELQFNDARIQGVS